MELKRFFANSIIDNKIMLSGQEFTHAVKVTRHKVGFKIIVCVGDGYDYYAEIKEIGKDYLLAEIYDKRLNTNEAKSEIILFQALCKEFDFILQKAVELGCSAVYPIITKRSQPYTFNYLRLESILLGAAKQCERAKLTKLFMPVSFIEALSLSKTNDLNLFCYENADSGSIPNLVAKDTKNIGLFIGSEGGFEEDEVELAKNSGLSTVSLGKRILRSETAVISSLALILNGLGEM